MRRVKEKGCQLEFGFLDDYKKDVVLPYFENPRDDNERLLNLQYEARNGDKSAYGRMYQIALPIAGKYVTEKCRTSKSLRLSREEREEKAHNAVTYVIESFLLDKDYFVKKNFTSVIYLRVLHELFYTTKADRCVSFVDDETMARLMDERQAAEDE